MFDLYLKTDFPWLTPVFVHSSILYQKKKIQPMDQPKNKTKTKTHKSKTKQGTKPHMTNETPVKKTKV